MSGVHKIKGVGPQYAAQIATAVGCDGCSTVTVNDLARAVCRVLAVDSTGGTQQRAAAVVEWLATKCVHNPRAGTVTHGGYTVPKHNAFALKALVRTLREVSPHDVQLPLDWPEVMGVAESLVTDKSVF